MSTRSIFNHPGVGTQPPDFGTQPIDSCRRPIHLDAMLLVHGTTVEIDGKGVLLRGPSGSGKSDLALRLMDRGAKLVADDQTVLVAEHGHLLASPPDGIAGLMEVRGMGIVRVEYGTGVPLAVVVDLVSPQEVERMPEPSVVTYLDIALPSFCLSPFEASASAKVRLAALSPTRDIMRS